MRIHAAELGMPIVGDDDHGGIDAARLFLHAAGLRIEHPERGPLDLSADRPPSFDRVLGGASADPAPSRRVVALEERARLFDPADTDGYLWIDRHHDGFAGVRVERLGDIVLVLNYDDHDVPLPLPDSWVDAWTTALDCHAGLRAAPADRAAAGDRLGSCAARTGHASRSPSSAVAT